MSLALGSGSGGEHIIVIHFTTHTLFNLIYLDQNQSFLSACRQEWINKIYTYIMSPPNSDEEINFKGLRDDFPM